MLSTQDISIVTVCLDAEKSIGQTIESVRKQTYPNIEYIIIDGGSTDNTIKIINNNKDVVTILITEPDSGIYNAMNKGIRASTGRVLFFLNSDDYFYDETVIQDIMECFSKNPNISLIYGDVLVEITGKLIPWNQAAKLDRKRLARQTISHQSIFARKEIFVDNGEFSEKFNIVSDYDWLMHLIHSGVESLHIQRNISIVGSGGCSSTTSWEFERLKSMRSYYTCLEILLWRVFPHQGRRIIRPLSSCLRYFRRLIHQSIRSGKDIFE